MGGRGGRGEKENEGDPSLSLSRHRPTDFLPGEFAGVRGIEQKMYKEQERLKLRSHADIMAAYVQHCSRLPLFDAVLFPARVRGCHVPFGPLLRSLHWSPGPPPIHHCAPSSFITVPPSIDPLPCFH